MPLDDISLLQTVRSFDQNYQLPTALRQKYEIFENK